MIQSVSKQHEDDENIEVQNIEADHPTVSCSMSIQQDATETMNGVADLVGDNIDNIDGENSRDHVDLSGTNKETDTNVPNSIKTVVDSTPPNILLPAAVIQSAEELSAINKQQIDELQQVKQKAMRSMATVTAGNKSVIWYIILFDEFDWL